MVILIRNGQVDFYVVMKFNLLLEMILFKVICHNERLGGNDEVSKLKLVNCYY